MFSTEPQLDLLRSTSEHSLPFSLVPGSGETNEALALTGALNAFGSPISVETCSRSQQWF